MFGSLNRRQASRLRARSSDWSRASRPLLSLARSTDCGIGYRMRGCPRDERGIPCNETGGDPMRGVLALSALAVMTVPGVTTAATRPLKPDDIFRLKEVSAPQVSPDGRSVAYEVTALDAD